MKYPYLYRRSAKDGSVLVLALVTIVILASILGIVLQTVSNRYWTAFQVAAWQEALFAAESGADIAMVEMRKSMQQDDTAWSGWTVIKKTGAASTSAPNLTGLQGDENLTRTYTLAPHAGEGNTALSATIVIDAPTTLRDASGRQWYRVRSTGAANVPGPARVSSEKLDNLLRRLSLVIDAEKSKITGTTVNVTTPKATRTIECVAKPTTMFMQALMSQVQIKNDGSGLIVDSYNSSDPTKSTNGVYDVTKRQSNGDIASNAFPIKHDKSMDLNIKNDYIFGDVSNNYSSIKGVAAGYFDGLDGHPTTNSDSLIKTDGNADPTGSITTDYYRDLPRISDPTWTAVTYNYGTLDKKDVDGTASADRGNPSKFIADKVDLSKDTWVVKLPPGATEAWAEMWVRGDIKMRDGGMIQVEEGVHLTVYFDHNLEISDSKQGAGFDVQSDNPADLILLGVEQKEKAKKNDDAYENTTYTPYKATGNIKLKDADLVASLYAPDHNLVVDVKDAAKRTKTNQGKGRTRLQSGVDVYGSFVARTIHAKGPANFHYDEELANVGPANDFAYISWFEDVNLDRR